MTDQPTIDLVTDLLDLANDTTDELWLALSPTKPDLCAAMSQRLGTLAQQAETLGIPLRTTGDTTND